MKLQRRTWVPIDYLDESPWQALLEKYPFWRDKNSYLSDGSIHQDLAYFVMVAGGQLAHPDTLIPSPHPFDQVTIPKEAFESIELQSLLSQWLGAHEAQFGPGQPLKCGFYCVAPGGFCNYHVDGSVLNLGERIDLSNPKEWDAIAMTQVSHRTVMPLRLNRGDRFLITGNTIRMTPGLLFEFSNTLPHAIFNQGDDFTVLLVTTWAAQSDMLQHSLVDLR